MPPNPLQEYLRVFILTHTKDVQKARFKIVLKINENSLEIIITYKIQTTNTIRHKHRHALCWLFVHCGPD
jgi:hypothetical protein